MTVFWLSLAAFVIVIGIMAVGVIFRRRPIRGSCGGIAAVMGQAGCDACDPLGRCTNQKTGAEVESDDSPAADSGR